MFMTTVVLNEFPDVYVFLAWLTACNLILMRSSRATFRGGTPGIDIHRGATHARYECTSYCYLIYLLLFAKAREHQHTSLVVTGVCLQLVDCFFTTIVLASVCLLFFREKTSGPFIISCHSLLVVQFGGM